MYAQVIKSLNNTVSLIGGAEEGLPIEHPDVICIDIGERIDVKVGMKYREDTGEFYEDVPDPIIVPPSVENRVAALEQAFLILL